jgi:hypothetical protein
MGETDYIHNRSANISMYLSIGRTRATTRIYGDGVTPLPLLLLALLGDTNEPVTLPLLPGNVVGVKYDEVVFIDGGPRKPALDMDGLIATPTDDAPDEGVAAVPFEETRT